MKQVTGWIGRLRGAISVVYREAVKFGAVGLAAYVIDLYVFNVFRSGWWPLEEAPLGHKAVVCKIISATVATVFAWAGNRWWTFRHRRQAAAAREFILFAVMNVGGIAIALACLGFSHYVLGLKSPLADNISANGVGLVLGTLFRFWAYRTLVFTELKDTLHVPVESTPAAVVSPLIDAVEGHTSPAMATNSATANGQATNGYHVDIDRDSATTPTEPRASEQSR